MVSTCIPSSPTSRLSENRSQPRLSNIFQRTQRQQDRETLGVTMLETSTHIAPVFFALIDQKLNDMLFLRSSFDLVGRKNLLFLGLRDTYLKYIMK